MNRVSVCALAVWAASGLAAHDLYLMPEKFIVKPGASLRLTFQNGDAFPVGGAAVKPGRLRDTRLRAKAGLEDMQQIQAGATATSAVVRVPGEGLAILTARTVPNFIELGAAKFKSYLEHENLTNVLAWRNQHGEAAKPGRERYSKYVKALVKAGKGDDGYRERTGLTIEIVPEADPYALAPGQDLPVLVLFQGKPAVDVAVESAWLEGGKSRMENIGRTNSEGRLRIPLKGAGPHRLHAIVMERCAEPKVADWESFWASLTFEVPAR